MIPKLSCLLLVFGCVVAVNAHSAQAADRMRAGQWEATITFRGQVQTRSYCVLPADADAMNGDSESIRRVIDRDSVDAGCKTTDAKIDGNKVVVTSVCAGRQSTATTTYHGDAFETVSSDGLTTQAKWLGPSCKK